MTDPCRPLGHSMCWVCGAPTEVADAERMRCCDDYCIGHDVAVQDSFVNTSRASDS